MKGKQRKCAKFFFIRLFYNKKYVWSTQVEFHKKFATSLGNKFSKNIDPLPFYLHFTFLFLGIIISCRTQKENVCLCIFHGSTISQFSSPHHVFLFLLKLFILMWITILRIDPSSLHVKANISDTLKLDLISTWNF